MMKYENKLEQQNRSKEKKIILNKIRHSDPIILLLPFLRQCYSPKHEKMYGKLLGK